MMSIWRVQVRTERAVLPAGHEKATDVQLAEVAAQVSAGHARDAQALLATVMDEEQEVIEKVLPPPRMLCLYFRACQKVGMLPLQLA